MQSFFCLDFDAMKSFICYDNFTFLHRASAAMTDLLHFSHQRGHLKIVARRGGKSYLYRLTLDGNYFSLNFPVGTPEDLLRTFLSQVDALIFEYRYRKGINSSVAMEFDEFKRRVMEIRARLLGLEFDMKVEIQKQSGNDGRTLGDLLSWYRNISGSERLANITVRYRTSALERLIKFLGKDFELGDVTRDRLNEFKRDLFKTNDNGAYWLLQKLQSVFRVAYYEGFMSHYPFLGFKYPRKENGQEQLILTPEEMRKIGELFTVDQPRLAWTIARFTGIRGNDLMVLEHHDFDFKRGIIRYRNHKLRRFEGVIIHPRLREYLVLLPNETGRVFSYRNEQSLSAVFRRAIRRFKKDDFAGMRLGTHTPRGSLAHYLRHTAKWPKEDIRIFLGHHDQDVTDGYLMESIETIRDRVNALPFK